MVGAAVSRKAGTHARTKFILALISHQGGFPLQDINEFVLVPMAMVERTLAARFKACQIDTEPR